MTRLLLGFGLREFSMHPAQLLAIKQQVLRTRLKEVEELAARVGRAHDPAKARRSEEHTSELQSPCNLVCRLLLEKKKIRCRIKRSGAVELTVIKFDCQMRDATTSKHLVSLATRSPTVHRSVGRPVRDSALPFTTT